jgi:hypothetical protein
MRYTRAMLVYAAIVIGLGLGIVLDLFPVLRGGFGWQWGYEIAPLAGVLLLLALVSLYGLGAWLLLRRTRRAWPVLLWAMLAFVVFSVAVVRLRYDDALATLVDRTTSVLATGFYFVGVDLGPDSEAWTEWRLVAEQEELYGGHVAVAPPGLPIAHALLAAGLDELPSLAAPLARPIVADQCMRYDLHDNTPGEWAAAWLGPLMPLLASLVIPAIYWLARRWPLTRSLSRETALLLPLVPGLILFAGNWSTVFPALAILALAALVVGMRKRRFGLVLVAGLLAGCGVFLNYAFLPLLVVLAVFTVLFILLIERPAAGTALRTTLQCVGLIAVGFLAPWLVYWLVSGDTLITLFDASLRFHLGLDRPYLPWVFQHLWDWVLFSGVGLALLALAGSLGWGRRPTGYPPVISLSLLIVMVALALSGTGRGEAGRVWLLYTPVLVLAAAEAIARLARVVSEQRLWYWLVFATSSAYLVAMAAAIPTIATEEVLAPSPSPRSTSLTPQDVVFTGANDALRLTGWSASIQDDAMILDLGWSVQDVPLDAYWFGAVLVAPDGQVYDAGLWQPGSDQAIRDRDRVTRGDNPTTCWLPTSQIHDRVALPLPVEMPGDWWISLSVFDRLGQALPTTDALGVMDQQAGLGPVRAGQ